MSWENPPGPYTFEDPIGNYNDTNLQKVDYLMSECKERGIRMIVSLHNPVVGYYWPHIDEPYIEQYGKVGFYNDPDLKLLYKNRIDHFLNHENDYINGKKWKDLDDVILAWEVQNESGLILKDVDYIDDSTKYDIMRNWFDEMCMYIKEIDSTTYVSLGIAGYGNYYNNGSIDDIKTLGNIEDADIYTLHFYGGDLNYWINDVQDYLNSIDKLLFVEEFGNTRDVGMSVLQAEYQYVTETCRNNGIPWMFWRMGTNEHNNCWCIFTDDMVWQQVFVPAIL